MTEDELTQFALSLPETTETAQIETRDFRVRGKVFMTLPGQDYCVLQLTPGQQRLAIATAAVPGSITAVQGGWGDRGSTRLYHAIADDATVRGLVRQAWKNAAPKSMFAQDTGY